MNSLVFKDNKLIRSIIVSIVCGLFILGCSGSSESQSPSEIDTVDDATANIVAGDDTSNNVSNDTNVVTTDSSQVTTTENTFTTTTSTVESEPTTLLPDTVDSSVVTEEPVTTRIDFDITVPAYQSNALQVRLQWGDKDILASFVVDESWSIVDDFPVDTENELVVTFNDDNGAVTLASFEQTFRTGTNPSESLQITADQFDTNRWDNDGDGVSNLAELMVGTNPLAADVSLPTESVINTAENIAQIFDIVGGSAVDVMSSAARALEISIDESDYLLLSTTSDGVALDNGLTLSDTRIYECPISGTVSKVEVRQEGVGFWNNLEADDCRDLDQVIDGEFTIGSRWTPHGHAFTTSNNATLSLNDDTYRLEAEQLHQQLNFNEEIRRNAFYVGADIQLSQNGISIYRVGSLNASEGNIRVFRSAVSDIVTSGIDIDEIETTIQFSKNESTEYFTTGTFVGSKNDIEVLVVDADTGDENTFSAITTSTGSTISAIYDWSPAMQFGRYPLPDQ